MTRKRAPHLALRRSAARLIAFYQTQMHLWDRYGQRYELSGWETRVARTEGVPLHWRGSALHGLVLPPR